MSPWALGMGQRSASWLASSCLLRWRRSCPRRVLDSIVMMVLPNWQAMAKPWRSWERRLSRCFKRKDWELLLRQISLLWTSLMWFLIWKKTLTNPSQSLMQTPIMSPPNPVILLSSPETSPKPSTEDSPLSVVMKRNSSKVLDTTKKHWARLDTWRSSSTWTTQSPEPRKTGRKKRREEEMSSTSILLIVAMWKQMSAESSCQWSESTSPPTPPCTICSTTRRWRWPTPAAPTWSPSSPHITSRWHSWLWMRPGLAATVEEVWLPAPSKVSVKPRALSTRPQSRVRKGIRNILVSLPQPLRQDSATTKTPSPTAKRSTVQHLPLMSGN